MNGYQGPINQENFSETWEYVNNKLIEIKKKRLIRKVVTFVGNVIFLAYFAIVSFGLLYTIKEPSFWEYLDKTPVFADVWKSVGPLLQHPNMHWVVQLLIYILPAFVIILAVCGIIFALVWFLYKPNIGKSMTDNAAEDAKELHRMAREAVIRAGNPPVATSFTCDIIYLLGLAIFLSKYLLWIIEIGNQEVLQVLIMFLITYMNYVGLAVFLILSAYSAINLLMGYMLKLMYVTKIPENLVADTEVYFYECNVEEKARIEEEERVLALAKEIRERRQAEENAFNEEIRRKNPIYKKIKIGVTIALIVGIMGFAAWLSQNINTEVLSKYINYDLINFEMIGMERPDITYDAKEPTEPYVAPEESDNVRDFVSMVDENNGYQLVSIDKGGAIVDKLLYRTSTGEGNFEQYLDVSAIPNCPEGIHFFTNEIGYIVTSHRGIDAYLFRTEDGGHTWKAQVVEIPVEEFSRVNAYSITDGVLVLDVMVGEDYVTYTYTTEDMGTTWILQKSQELEE